MEVVTNKRPMSVGALCQVGGERLTHPLDANTFAVTTGDGVVLIEAGSKLGYHRLRRNLGRVGLRVADIKVVLATHGHWDHVSGMGLLAKESDAKLYVPEEDIAGVETGDTILTAAYFYGQKAEPLEVAGIVTDGFCLHLGDVAVRAIATPGHTPGSVCYRVEQPDSTTLITGDAVFGSYFPRPGRNACEDIELNRESLKRLQGYSDFDYIAIGHSMMGFRGDVTARLEEAARQLTPAECEVFSGNPTSAPLFINPWYKANDQYYRF